MNNRNIFLLLAGIILILGVASFAFWQQTRTRTAEVFIADGSQAQITIEDAQLNAEQATTIPIYFNADTDVGTVEVILSYNENYIEITSITPETTLFDFSSPTIDNDDPSSATATFIANSTTGATTNGQDIQLASIRIVPHIPSGITQTVSTQINLSSSRVYPLTSLTENLLAQPENPTITITPLAQIEGTALILEDKNLTLNQQNTIDIKLVSQETITEVHVVIYYNPAILDISDFVESPSFTNYPEVDFDTINGQVVITAQASPGVDASTQDEILVATLVVTPLEATTTSTGLSFEFSPGDTTDTNVATATSLDILDQVDDGTYTIYETLTVACFESCDYDYQCPGDSACENINGDSICINLNCTDSTQCNNCAESDYYSQATAPSNNFTGGNLAPQVTPEASPPAVPNLPAAGTQEITLLVLGLGITILFAGIYIKKNYN